MGSRPLWRRQVGSPEEVLALLELVASEQPTLLGFVVEALASSPARPAVLEMASFFKVEGPVALAGAVATVAGQLDQIERQPQRRWTTPRDLFGDSAASAIVLERFSQARAVRWRGIRPGIRRSPRLVRADRRIKDAAGHERAAALVAEFLR